jgi:DUF1365 family protein
MFNPWSVFFIYKKNKKFCYLIIAIFPNLCSFVSEPCYIAFHDEEWGVPIHDDKYVG